MIITMYNKKGGTGKTSLAFNIAKDLDYFLLSNDDSVIESIYKNKAKILDKLEIPKGDNNLVFDLGGFIESETIDIFKGSDLIIVPTTLDINSIKRTINTVKELEEFNTNIIIIINRVKNKNIEKYKNSIEALKDLKKEIFLFRETEAIVNSVYKGKSIIELCEESNLMKNVYKGVIEDYKKILDNIKRIK